MSKFSGFLIGGLLLLGAVVCRGGEPADIKPEPPPPAQKEVAKPETPSHASVAVPHVEMAEANGPCAGPGCEVAEQPSRCRHFLDWLTYRPLERPGIGGCCHHCQCCATPPLYTFFLCEGCGGSHGCCGTGCDAGQPCGAGKRLLFWRH